VDGVGLTMEGAGRGCNALNLGVEFFLLFFHQIQALPFSLSHSLAKP
jgi:hypothetical protein